MEKLFRDEKMNVKIVGLCGKKGSGKSSIAHFLCGKMPEVTELVPFAWPLKKMCMNAFGLSLGQVESQEGKDAVHEKSGMTVRQILQHVGTDVFRKIDPDCWVRMWEMEVLKISKPHGVVIIVPDVRFPNEAAAVREMGGIVIGLLRKPADDDHESEQSVDECVCDGFINNREMDKRQQNEAVWKRLTMPGGYLEEMRELATDLHG
jgi:energy-coupling factor transporter ATP-binding protein EcfA2